MRYKFQLFLSFFLLSVSGLLWVNYYPLVNQVKAQIVPQKPLSSKNIFEELQKGVFNTKNQQPEEPFENRDGGSRTDEICIITPWFYKSKNSPEKFVAEVFSEQPIFIWKGDRKEIFIENPESQKEIWAEYVDNMNKIVYQGNLEKEKVYHLFLHEGAQTIGPFPFRIIGGDRRSIIEADLQKLEKETDGLSAEEIALLRANYFLKQGLLWDAFNEMFSVEKFATEFITTLKKARMEEFCPNYQKTEK